MATTERPAVKASLLSPPRYLRSYVAVDGGFVDLLVHHRVHVVPSCLLFLGVCFLVLSCSSGLGVVVLVPMWWP